MALTQQTVSVLLLVLATLLARADEQAEDWQRLLQRGGPAEQTDWAARYEHGEGVERDMERAIRLYCAAAERGNTLAQYRLGWIYANGRGVARDDALAVAWFRRAAARNDPYSKQMLARLDAAKLPRTAARCVTPTGVVRRQSPVLHGPGRRHIEALVKRLAPDYDLDPALVIAVIEAESAFQIQARSPKNAQGLMQLIPATAKRFGVRKIMDPVQNLHGGMAYLRWLLAFFQGDVRLALAGYNAGENAVLKYRGVPPFPETRAYVAKITRRYGRTQHPPVTPVVAPAALSVSWQERPSHENDAE